MESFKRGDRVALKEPLGPLTDKDFGLVVEVYADESIEFVGAEVAGTKDFEALRSVFDYGVVFPRLRGWMSDYSSKWETDKVDLSQFHAGDIIPCIHDELNFIDSELRELM